MSVELQTPDAESIHRILRDGTASERRALLRAVAPSWADDVGPLVDSDRRAMRVVALGPAAIGACAGQSVAVGEQLALALHRLGVEIMEIET